jgi:putative colanic acid biosynthesis UDP-glucose lipid carrier transferase
LKLASRLPAKARNIPAAYPGSERGARHVLDTVAPDSESGRVDLFRDRQPDAERPTHTRADTVERLQRLAHIRRYGDGPAAETEQPITPARRSPPTREAPLSSPPGRNAPAGSTSLFRVTFGLINRLVMLTDLLAILSSAGLFWIGTDNPPLSWAQTLIVALLIAISFVSILRSTGKYRVECCREFWCPLVNILGGLPPAALIAAVILEAFIGPAWRSGGWSGGGLLVILLGLVIGRQFDRLLIRSIGRRALLRRRVVVVGAGSLTDQLIELLRQPKYQQDYQLVGVFDNRPEVPATAAASACGESGRLTELFSYAQTRAIDLVIIALPWNRADEIFELVHQLQWIAADVVVPFPKTGFRPQFAPPIQVIDAPLLQLMHRPFKGTQGLVKIAEDYLVAGIGLLLAWPIMLIAACAIWLEDGRPILFRQPRVGFNSRPFSIFKFRTMCVDPSDDGSKGTTRDDQRITRIGRFLRRSSIDELPQLFNVLRGEMSIVGPRPHVANMRVGEGIYSEVAWQYAARHRIKPGITGWAQINGMRGGIDSAAKAKRGADLDLYYVANWSLRLDLTIMVRTLAGSLFGHDVF